MKRKTGFVVKRFAPSVLVFLTLALVLFCTYAETTKSDIAPEINPDSLKIYLDDNFEFFVKQRYSYPSECLTASQELQKMGIETMAELEGIFPEDFKMVVKEVYDEEMSFSSSYVGIIRSALMINDVTGYFEKAWEQKWDTIDEPQIRLLQTYEIDIESYIETFGLEII